MRRDASECEPKNRSVSVSERTIVLLLREQHEQRVTASMSACECEC